MERYDLTEAAARSGVGSNDLARMCELGIITPDDDGRFTSGHLRRAGLVASLTTAGIPLEGFAEAIRAGQVSLDFLDMPTFERFSTRSGDTFAEVAERTNVPVESLLSIREATGSMAPAPGDRMRDEELPIAALFETAIGGGMRPDAVEHLIRLHAESLRRVAEIESTWWQAEVVRPAMEAGRRPEEIWQNDFSVRMSGMSERTIIALYHLQQTRAWTEGLIDGLEMALAAAGLHTRVEHPPAMCFLDISGYTRLTQEHGDAAAADVADRLGAMVARTSVKFGGRPVKWLGDGVMLHYPDPGQGVVAALEMVAAVAGVGLPPAHVGLHAGPVIFQDGDYYGSTVNVASRIADYAQAGEVIVSQAVVDACGGAPVTFRDLGLVELKGVAGGMHLHAASAAVAAS